MEYSKVTLNINLYYVRQAIHFQYATTVLLLQGYLLQNSER